jgi:HSP20 family protein
MLSIHHDPFVHDAFQHFFKPLFSGVAAPVRRARPASAPQVELTATETGWALFAELPGVAPEAVELEVSEHEVKLSYELPDGTPEGMRKLGGDRKHGTIQRHWRVRRAIDIDAVEATFDKGQLNVSLTARGATAPRKIAIKSV